MMSTLYAGREDEIDLGEGHSYLWMHDGYFGPKVPEHKIIGLIEHHPHLIDADHPFGYCGGYVAWTPSSRKGGWITVRHELVSGSPGDEAHVTIAPSLNCPMCASHGFIRAGKWEDAA
jgi:hypothetical protein